MKTIDTNKLIRKHQVKIYNSHTNNDTNRVSKDNTNRGIDLTSTKSITVMVSSFILLMSVINLLNS